MSNSLLKFVVVLHKRSDFTDTQFTEFLRTIHGPMALRLPGLRKYIQNYPIPDPLRPSPRWSAVVELYWDNREAMEAAWASPEGRRATEDLAEFADLNQTSWSVVDEVMHL